MNRVLLLLYFLSSSIFISAKVKLPAILSDNMVLQQKTTICLWGTARPNSKIKINASWINDVKECSSDDKGLWEISVKTPEAGGPFSITFDDGDITVLQNILIGEVWLCSGQSNMEMPVKGFFSQPVVNSTQVIADAVPETGIRMFSVKKATSLTVMDDLVGKWEEHTPLSVKNFSATAYFFGKQLYESLNVPIGLINTSWGGSKIEAWMPEDILRTFPEISLEHLKNKPTKLQPQHTPTLLHNAMLYPLKNFKIKGAIWYQGEANRLNPKLYSSLFVTFVDYVRSLFDTPLMPFYYCQIAPFSYGNSKGYEGAELREAQFNCENQVKNVGMAVLMDLGEEYCIHPANKTDAGKRLAFMALNKTYGKEAVPAFSPKYKGKKIEGDKIILDFDNVEMGLTSFGNDLDCFEIAGSDKVFHKAKAKIMGRRVQVWCDSVKNPIAVRYAFYNYARGDLFGVNGLPVSSFRTDF